MISSIQDPPLPFWNYLAIFIWFICLSFAFMVMKASREGERWDDLWFAELFDACCMFPPHAVASPVLPPSNLHPSSWIGVRQIWKWWVCLASCFIISGGEGEGCIYVRWEVRAPGHVRRRGRVRWDSWLCPAPPEGEGSEHRCIQDFRLRPAEVERWEGEEVRGGMEGELIFLPDWLPLPPFRLPITFSFGVYLLFFI